jgi:hypothetical protein
VQAELGECAGVDGERHDRPFGQAFPAPQPRVGDEQPSMSSGDISARQPGHFMSAEVEREILIVDAIRPAPVPWGTGDQG